MKQDDARGTQRVSILRALVRALAYSSVPVPRALRLDTMRYKPPSELGLTMALFPIVGLALGGLHVALWKLASLVWTPPVAIFVVWLFILVHDWSMHDGVADVADAMLQKRPVEKALRIFKDPTNGTLAAVALLAIVGGQLVLLESVPRTLVVEALVLRAVVARWGMTLLVYRGQAAYPTSSLVGYIADLRASHVAFGTLTACSVAMFSTTGARVVVLVLGCVVIALGIRRWASVRIGGIVGDVVNAAHECMAVFVLLALLARRQ